jgi:hypothetical protein
MRVGWQREFALWLQRVGDVAGGGFLLDPAPSIIPPIDPTGKCLWGSLACITCSLSHATACRIRSDRAQPIPLVSGAQSPCDTLQKPEGGL